VPATGVDLPEKASAELRQVATGAPDLAPRTSSTRWGGRWHCPHDGEFMDPVDGYVRRGECGRCLPGHVLYQLLEFNWHPS
jgi:hypothetical protein